MGGPQPKKSKVLEIKDLGATWTDITGFPANFTEGTSTAVTHAYYEPLVCVNITSGDLEDDDFPDS